jgi:Domain of unknown function (DUF4410)
MKVRAFVAASVLASLALSGCASTRVTQREPYQGKRLARPDRILVYDFAATGTDLPAWSAARDFHAEPSEPRSAEDLATGRELGAEVAKDLVAEIRDMGLPAVPANGQTPREGDIALVGYFESIDEGSRLKRLVIGFGSGSAELKTQVEGYVATDSGMRRLGSTELDSGGNKMPGMAIPAIVTVATANPIGLIVGGAIKGTGELTGRTTIEGTARRTADAIADELRAVFHRQGWI